MAAPSEGSVLKLAMWHHVAISWKIHENSTSCFVEMSTLIDIR